jgi:sterol 24-C-methyltransferase
MTVVTEDRGLERVRRYYACTESRLGYRYLMRGTRHHGWYEPGQSMWQFARAQRRMEDELGKRLALPVGAEALDAGCGSGDVARTLATRYRLKITGIDLLDFHLEQARRRITRAGLAGRISCQVGDYHHLPFTDHSFDGVYTMETLVHSADPARALAEFRRVLRPGGRLVMFEYSRTPETELSREANAALKAVCELCEMPTWLSMNHGDMERLLKQQGFADVWAEDATRRMLPMLHAFSILGRIPYLICRATGHATKLVNAMWGVEIYQHRNAFQYNIYVAHKSP